jgi:hypothetical protein
VMRRRLSALGGAGLKSKWGTPDVIGVGGGCVPGPTSYRSGRIEKVPSAAKVFGGWI